MNKDFPRIITLLRKERGISQKKASEELGISQALLSHYEKGVRECGLEFVVKISDFYDVSCDYILGRSPEKSGNMISVTDIPESTSIEKENTYKGSLLPTLNKKLISNSLYIVFDMIQQLESKEITTELSVYLMLSVYKVFRLLYSLNPQNHSSFFSIPGHMYVGFSNAAQSIAETNALNIIASKRNSIIKDDVKKNMLKITPEKVSERYPLFASSLYNLIQSAETRMGAKKKDKK